MSDSPSVDPESDQDDGNGIRTVPLGHNKTVLFSDKADDDILCLRAPDVQWSTAILVVGTHGVVLWLKQPKSGWKESMPTILQPVLMDQGSARAYTFYYSSETPEDLDEMEEYLRSKGVVARARVPFRGPPEGVFMNLDVLIRRPQPNSPDTNSPDNRITLNIVAGYRQAPWDRERAGEHAAGKVLWSTKLTVVKAKEVEGPLVEGTVRTRDWRKDPSLVKDVERKVPAPKRARIGD